MQAVLVAVVAVGGSQVFKLALGPSAQVKVSICTGRSMARGSCRLRRGWLGVSSGGASGWARAVIDAGGVQALNGQAPLQQLAQVPGQR